MRHTAQKYTAQAVKVAQDILLGKARGNLSAKAREETLLWSSGHMKKTVKSVTPTHLLNPASVKATPLHIAQPVTVARKVPFGSYAHDTDEIEVTFCQKDSCTGGNCAGGIFKDGPWHLQVALRHALQWNSRLHVDSFFVKFNQVGSEKCRGSIPASSNPDEITALKLVQRSVRNHRDGRRKA